MEKQDKNENVTVDDLIEEFGAEGALKVFLQFGDEDLSWAKNLMINAKKVRNWRMSERDINLKIKFGVNE